jgi:hypothetical protein
VRDPFLRNSSVSRPRLPATGGRGRAACVTRRVCSERVRQVTEPAHTLVSLQ